MENPLQAVPADSGDNLEVPEQDHCSGRVHSSGEDRQVIRALAFREINGMLPVLGQPKKQLSDI